MLDLANAVTQAFELAYPNASLGQALQKALPDAKVVKSLNTLGAPLMVNPSAIGPSTVFLSGDDAEAKRTVAGLLGDLGWPEDAILDLGAIASARGAQHYFLLFAAIWQATGRRCSTSASSPRSSRFGVRFDRERAPRSAPRAGFSPEASPRARRSA